MSIFASTLQTCDPTVVTRSARAERRPLGPAGPGARRLQPGSVGGSPEHQAGPGRHDLKAGDRLPLEPGGAGPRDHADPGGCTDYAKSIDAVIWPGTVVIGPLSGPT